MAVLLTFRYVGLPKQIGERLDAELVKNGLTVTYAKLYLDSFARVVARDLTVRHRDRDGEQSLQVERLRFSFNWLSWWRGESFLESAYVFNADLLLPLDNQTGVSLRDVDAEVEFRPSELVIRRFKGRCLSVDVQVRGRLNFEGFQPGPPMTDEQRAARAALWKRIESALSEVETRTPLILDVEGEVNLGSWTTSRLNVQLEGTRFSWRNVLAERLVLDARFEDELARVNVDMDCLRGGLRAEASWAAGRTQAKGQFESTIDLSLLAPLFPAKVRDFLVGVRFRSLPVNEGTFEAEWSGGFAYFLQTRSSWEDFSIGETYFESLYLPFSTDGRRFMVPQLTLKGRTGEAKAQLFYDGGEVLRASLSSSLDPTHFAPLFGPGAKPFFDSLKFGSGGPQVTANVEGKGLSLAGALIKGTVRCENFSYKGVALREINSSFVYGNDEIHLPDLVVKRTEGEGSGDVRHNFKSRMVWLKNIKSQLNLAETARIIGDKMEEYARPYRFLAAPRGEASGVVDVEGQKLTDLKVHIVSPEGLNYRFLGQDILLSKVDADLNFKGSRLVVTPRKPFTVFEGSVDAVLTVDLTERADYRVKANFNELNFGQLMRTYFGNNEVSGSLGGDANLQGRLDDIASIEGYGALNITKGALYDIPIFGGFSTVLNSIIPNLGYAVADKARAEYVFKGGVVTIDKLDVYSAAFALIGKGSYDYVKDVVDMDMRVNARGILGTALFPFSKLFEYEGKGSMNDTKWAPKAF